MPLLLLSLVRWVLASVTALACVLGGNRLMLCFEPDGHVSIELSGGDCGQCCPGESGEETREPSLAGCPCDDVALTLPDFAGQKRVALGAAHSPLALVPLVELYAPPPAPPSVRKQVELPRSHASLALAIVRSVVILV